VIPYSSKGYIKGIIGLPANLFYGTGIPACIIVESAATASRNLPASTSASFKTIPAIGPEIIPQLFQRFSLSWSHYVTLLTIINPDERCFYFLMDKYLPHWQQLREELNQSILGHETWEY
jgi:hypothetical protein